MTWHRVVIGDAREVLRQLGAGTADLLVTSPPYFDLKRYPDAQNAICTHSLVRYLEDLRAVFEESFRVLRDGRFCCVVAGQYTSEKVCYFIPGDLVRLLEEVGFQYKREHIWVKPKGTQGIWNRGTTRFLRQPYPRNAMINIHHEHILIFQKGSVPHVKQSGELTADEVKQYAWSVWVLPVSPVKEHPAPFPEQIPARLIRMYSYEKEVVLDPFLGSGTTCKAARDLNRNSLGIEVNPAFLAVIERTLGLQQATLEPADYGTIRFDLGQRLDLPLARKRPL